MRKSLKTKLRNREITIGSWLTFSDPAVAEIMADFGFDWLVIDMEHSGLSVDQAQHIIRTIDLKGVSPLVRVMENDPNLIKKYMDMGAHGVIVPLVNTRQDAEKAVGAVKYPPEGTRGVGLSRAQNYSVDFESYRQWNENESIVIIQVEHIDAVRNLDSIMDVNGVDGFIVGSYDLSGSLNCPGEFDNPAMRQAVDEIKRKSSENNYLFGQHIVTTDPKPVIEKINEGVRFVGFGVDFLFLRETIMNSFGKLFSSINKV